MASIKRIEGKGGVSYKITVSMGRDAQNKQIRHYKTWKPDQGMTARQMEREAQREAYKFELEITRGFAADDRQTFAEYAAYHQSIRKQRGDRPGTIEVAQRVIDRAIPYIGHMRLADIRPQHLNAYYKALAEPGANRSEPRAALRVPFETLGVSQAELARLSSLSISTIAALKQGGTVGASSAEKIKKALHRRNIFTVSGADKPLSSRTIENHHQVLSAIFAQAELEMIIPYNPAAKTVRPKRKPVSEVECLQPDQLQEIVSALDSEGIKLRTMMYLFMVTGCRRGEIMALKWSKVDYQMGQITVDASLSYLPDRGIYEGPTKTGNVRYIAIPQEVMQLLKQYQRWQTEQRLKVGDQWHDTGYIFTRWNGEPQNPTNVNTIMAKFCKRHRLPPIHPHIFRHTAASIMIARGVDILTVSKMLGHSSTSMTLDVYGHAIEESKRKAAECISNAILRKKQA